MLDALLRLLPLFNRACVLSVVRILEVVKRQYKKAERICQEERERRCMMDAGCIMYRSVIVAFCVELGIRVTWRD